MHNINLIKRTTSNYTKKLLVIGVFHGDEPQGEYFIESYLKNAKNPTKNCVYFIPRLNKTNTRTNENGVDLNRNFPTKNWTERKKDEYWGGNNPNSEIETKFLVQLIDENKFDAIITIHSPYKVINFDGPAENISKEIQKFLNYKITNNIGYPTPGSFGTYCGIERKIPTVTIEIDEEDDIEKLNEKFSKLFFYLENEY